MPRFLQEGFVLCLTFVLLLASVARAETATPEQLQAAYIVNFLQFVKWPDGRSIPKQTRADICVVGDSAIVQTGEVFKQASKRFSNLGLSVMVERNIKNADHCHVLFISKSEEGRLADILAALKGKALLTVSDIENFGQQGGMIEFALIDSKMKLIINTKATADAGMRIDADLLGIALKVIDK